MKNNLIKNMLGTMIAVPLIGASASQVGAMPSGMAKDLSGAAVGLQGVSLIGYSIGSMSNFKNIKGKIKIIGGNK